MKRAGSRKYAVPVVMSLPRREAGAATCKPFLQVPRSGPGPSVLKSSRRTNLDVNYCKSKTYSNALRLARHKERDPGRFAVDTGGLGRYTLASRPAGPLPQGMLSLGGFSLIYSPSDMPSGLRRGYLLTGRPRGLSRAR